MIPSRRNHLKTLLAAAGGASLAGLQPLETLALTTSSPSTGVPPPDHERRIQWWREAKFGMFIHWGLYSVLGSEAWAMGDEDIPLEEYEKLGRQFRPQPDVARTWARLARESGMRYMVMTTKHHEGFCLFDTKLTNYCAPQQGPGRDLVKEYVAAARAEGICAWVSTTHSWIGTTPIGELRRTDSGCAQRDLWSTRTDSFANS